MNYSYNPTHALRGIFVPLWLLTRPDIEHGAKMAYVLLIQKANPRGITRIYVPAIASELGDEESNVNGFLIELERIGLIQIHNHLGATDLLECRFTVPPFAECLLPHRGINESVQSHSKANSRHSQEMCIQYAKAKQRAGEEIRNVYALAMHFYKTGHQDEEIDNFLCNGNLNKNSG